MVEEKKSANLPHNLILKGRKDLSISGVLDVDSFDESMVVAYTELGQLTINGQNLHINRIDLDSGDLDLEGNIASLEYIDNAAERSFFSKLFR